jgi:hypothetical protein
MACLLDLMANMATDYTGEFSLVQSNNFTTMFLLSRNQHPDEKVIDVSAFFRAGREDNVANLLYPDLDCSCWAAWDGS